MAHNLPRLSKSILNSPQLITAGKFQEISEVLENREYLKGYDPEAFLDLESLMGEDNNLVDESVGILRVEGPTTYKSTGFEALCGGCSYTNLLSQMNTFVEEGKKVVLMKIDSPGGQAYRMQYTSRELRRLADENGIRLIGYIDGMMASAGIGLGVACHELISNPEASSGSIGVVISLLDNSAAMEKAGVKRVFITAGSEKVPFESDGTFRESFLADLKESVTDLYKKFTIHIAEMRNIDVQTVRDTEARMFKATDALSLGLIDKIMEENEFYDYLNSLSAELEDEDDEDNKQKSKYSYKEKVMPESFDMAAFEAMQAELTALKAEKELAVVTAKKASLTASLSTATYLSNVEGVVAFLMSADENQAIVLNTILSDANTALSTQAEKLAGEALLAETESTAKLEAKQVEIETVLKEKEDLKAEFAVNAAVRGEEKEENLVALGHKEKLARAVETVKAKKLSK